MPDGRYNVRMFAMCKRLAILLALVVPGVLGTVEAQGQVSDVTLSVDTDFVGVGGNVQSSQWTPMRLNLTSYAAEPRSVVCRWLLRDQDGDRVIAERQVTLNPNLQTYLWLYAAVPMRHQPNVPWTVQAVDAGSREILAEVQVTPQEQLSPTVQLIGVMGPTMGLEAYTGKPYTQHEPVGLIRGLEVQTLPDRWYGLVSVDTLIWTVRGGDPGAAPPQVQTALREWVRRGGHLVLVLPTFGEPWSGSPLGDMLPIRPEQMRRLESFDLLELGPVGSEDLPRVPALVFDVPETAGTSVVARAGQDENAPAYVVAGRYGFGRVTVIGVNLASAPIRQLKLPNGRQTIWNDVFNWATPIFPREYLQAQVEQNQIVRPTWRDPTILGYFLPSHIAMTNTAITPMLVAILMFGLYWLVAGPGTFALLKAYGLHRYSWVAFLITVVVFSGAAWGLAWAFRPHELRLEHFSFMDIDGNSGVVRTHTWLSVLIPTFGQAEVAVDPARPDEPNTLANAGVGLEGPDAPTFIDPQTYRFDAAYPSNASIPTRSTARTFSAQFLGPLIDGTPGLVGSWGLPRLLGEAQVHAPGTALRHRLPGTLENVLVIYAPGDGATPLVWRAGAWKPGEALSLKPPAAGRDELYKRLPHYGNERQWKQEGYLGSLVGHSLGRSNMTAAATATLAASQDQMTRDLEALSFFEALPPPNFRHTSAVSAYQLPAYRRPFGRWLDLTHLLDARRLIVMGHLTDSPMPIPFTVDGGEVDRQHGWTVVRWIYDF